MDEEHLAASHSPSNEYDTPAVRAVADVLEHFNGLAAPNGTSFYKRESGGRFSIIWCADVYTYVAGAKPSDPNFRGNNGFINIIIVHGGTVVVKPASDSKAYSLEMIQRVRSPPTITPYKHLPASNTGQQIGDDWTYSIDYEEIMPLFKNQGNETFDFHAVYKDGFVRSLSKQTGAEIRDGLEFSVKFEKKPKGSISFDIAGLSIFKGQDPKAFPATFSFEGSIDYDSGHDKMEWSYNVNLNIAR